MLKLEDVDARYADGILALSGISLTVSPGEVCAVLGPNGAGKSTLARLLSGAMRPTRGRVTLFGDDLATLDLRAIAQRIAVVPQSVDVAFGFTVRQVVAMGRAPYQGAWMRPSAEDEAVVARSLAACDLEPLADRPVMFLSGGEQKRVAIARALAQSSRALVLDEAASHLDIRHAIDLHEVVCREVTSRQLVCVVILHDLNVAARYADRVVLLKSGKLVAHGSVEEVMTYRRLKEVFEAELYVGVNELDNRRYFLPVRPRA